ncbi:hypothetical protein [Dysgonomonas sp. 25]|uniref:hypothetical protein n=1 Tax=Dysgonomonas sp. 25 TaxID=2302933 RepID=UPI0013D47B3B|nr:hypothetical protein [Dysgonomonas sp. 25]NDV68563.1 hypothetical protein [Dysgonomonas sp. 25]
MNNKEKEIFEAGKYKCPIPIPNIKKGDVLFCKSPTSIWLCIVSHIEGDKVYYHANYNITAKLLNLDDWFLVDYINRKATSEEKIFMLKELEKNKLCWIESQKIIFQTDKLLIVPDTINIFQLGYNDKQLGIGTQNDSVILLSSEKTYGLYHFQSEIFEKVDCVLIPCNYKDLQPKDIAFRTKNNPNTITPDIQNPMDYVKIMEQGYVYICGESLLKAYDTEFFWFKVVKG